jgi:hypothetical protein
VHPAGAKAEVDSIALDRPGLGAAQVALDDVPAYMDDDIVALDTDSDSNWGRRNFSDAKHCPLFLCDHIDCSSNKILNIASIGKLFR